MLIGPDWAALRRGPLFRQSALLGGIPIRHLTGKIWLLGNFRSSSYQKVELSKKFTEMNEDEFSEADGPKYERNLVITFQGDGRHFLDLAGEHRFIKEELFRIASRSVLKELRSCGSVVTRKGIFLNVRLGRDFRKSSTVEEYKSNGALLTPLQWYVHALRCVRSMYTAPVPAYVISDGSHRELRPLLTEPSTYHVQTTHALTDLLLMSEAVAIIGSGGSSFSAWGGYLAQCDIFSMEGQSFNWFKLQSATTGRVVTLPMPPS